MKFSICIAAVLGAICGAPALAQNDSSEEVSEAEADPNKVTCERRAITGSRAHRQRICMTNAQWEELRRTGNRDADNMIGDGTRIGVSEGGGGF